MKKRFGLYLASVFLLAACQGQNFNINIQNQAIPFEELRDKNNCELVYSPNFSADIQSIEGREYATQIEKILYERGINIVDKKASNCQIIVGYNIEGPFTEKASVPVFGQTGISSSSSYTTASAYGYSNYATGSAHTTTTYTPSFGITGYRTYDVYVYNRWLAMRATDSNGNELWNAVIKSTGSNDNLRVVFPLLAYMAGQSIMDNVSDDVSINERQAEKIYQKMFSDTEFQE